MRDFMDKSGRAWMATVQVRPGDDYKGRYAFVVCPGEGVGRREFPLDDVRWNSEKTAERTLQTMSEWELRRRLEIALGRGMGRATPV